MVPTRGVGGWVVTFFKILKEYEWYFLDASELDVSQMFDCIRFWRKSNLALLVRCKHYKVLNANFEILKEYERCFSWIYFILFYFNLFFHYFILFFVILLYFYIILFYFYIILFYFSLFYFIFLIIYFIFRYF